MQSIHRSASALVLVAVLALALPTGTLGQDDVRFGTGGWELSLLSGQFNDEPEFMPEGTSDQFLHGAIWGVRAGYVLPSNLFVQADVANAWVEIEPVDGPEVNTNVYMYGGTVGYNFQPARRLQLFLAGGADAVSWHPDGFDSETDLAFKYGGGVRFYLAPQFALRGDVRWHQVRDAFQDTRAQALGVSQATEEDLYGLELSAGLSVFLGGPKDSDGDGVYDDADACPGTPEGARVDDRGCALDRDGDGVPDGLDRCPRTPAGADVDAEGCPSDSDEDGVLDGIDECPDTPARATVDASGCPSDSDGDAVLNGLDECPNTPDGAEVDDRGCPTGALGILLRDFLPELNRLSVWFDFDEASIWEGSRPALDLVGNALVQNPEIVVEVQGYTDRVGAEDYNERLGLRRAEAVREYLMSTFPAIEDDQVSVRSYGEERPAADNDTAAGRQKNRRAMVVVVRPEAERSTDGGGGGEN